MAQREKYDGQRLPKTKEEIRAHFRHWDFFGKDIQQFAIDRGLINYMIIKPGTGRNLGLCTHCGKWVELEEGYSREERKNWEQDSRITCPECGAPVYVLVRRSTRESSCFFYWWERSILNPQDLVFRGIHVTRKLQRDAWEDPEGLKVPDLLIDLDSAAVFIYGKGSAMARAVSHYECKKDAKNPQKITWEKVTEMKIGAVRERSGVYTSVSNTRCIRAADSLKDAIRGTPFAWSEWEAWDEERDRIFQSDLTYDGNGGYAHGDWNIDRELIFFARFARYPAWEYLMKMGLGKLLGKYTDKMDGEVTKVLNLRGKDVDHIFRTHLTKEDKKYMLKGTIDRSGILGTLQQWRRYHPEASLEDVHWIVDHMHAYVEREVWNRDDMHRVYRLVSPGKLRAYVEKQDREVQEKEEKKKRVRTGGWLPGRDYGTVGMTEYRDYLDELDYLGYDLTKKDNLFPSDFRKAHEHAAKEVVALKVKLDEVKWDRRRDSCRKKYDFRDNEKGMEVIVPQHISDLVKEGEAMHNCVGTYMTRVANGDTDVVFVRRTAKPEESYITVEVNPRTGRIIQAREKYNADVKGKPAKDFMEAFAAHAARAAKKYRTMGESPKLQEGRKAE